MKKISKLLILLLSVFMALSLSACKLFPKDTSDGEGQGTQNPESGDPKSGDPKSGDPESGDPQSGDPQSGDPQTDPNEKYYKDSNGYVYAIQSVTKANASYETYKETKEKAGVTDDTANTFKTSFTVADVEYYAGDDNPLDVKPEILFTRKKEGVDQTANDSSIKKDLWKYEITVKLLGSDGEPTDEDVASYIDKIDYEKCTVDFSQAAVGKKFEITVDPMFYTAKQVEDNEDFSTVIDSVTVVDGWNVYSALELAYFDSRKTDVTTLKQDLVDEFREVDGIPKWLDDDYVGYDFNFSEVEEASLVYESTKAWEAFKAYKGINVNTNPNAVVLQTNIELNIDSEIFNSKFARLYNELELTLEGILDYENQDYASDVKALCEEYVAIYDTLDIPLYFFYNFDEITAKGYGSITNALGSMKDNAKIYYHYFGSNDETFDMYGNYFQVDISSLKQVVVFNGDKEPATGAGAMDHTVLFCMNARDTNVGSDFESVDYFYFANAIIPSFGEATIQDISVIGNSPRTADTYDAGGVIVFGSVGTDTTIDNVITTGCCISFSANRVYTEKEISKTDEHLDPIDVNRFDRLDNEYVITNSKAFDSFCCFVWNWGSDVVTTNCYFNGCGGPAVINNFCDYSDYSAETGNITTGYHHYYEDKPEPAKDIDIYAITKGQEPTWTSTNCTIINFVTGEEAWFNLTGQAGNVTQIKGLDAVIQSLTGGNQTPGAASFIKNDGEYSKMNLISVLNYNPNSSTNHTELTGGEIVFGTHAIVGEEPVLITETFNYFTSDPNDALVNALYHAYSAAPTFSILTGTTEKTEKSFVLIVPGNPLPPSVLNYVDSNASTSQQQGDMPGTSLMTQSNTPTEEQQAVNVGLASADHIAIYYGGMMIILELIHAQA